MNILDEFIDLLFPKVCFGCDIRLQGKEKILCSDCEGSLQFLTGVCEICGSPENPSDCPVCNSNKFVFDKARSVYIFSKTVQNLIHELKYNEMKRIAKYMGEYVSEYLHLFQPFGNVDIIAPVPLHMVKKRARGFNQAEFLSKEISGHVNWLHIPKLVLRNRFTDTQTKLNRKQRQENVSDAFTLNPKFEIQNKNILIVDDVFTTGATVNSICKLLKKNHAAKIYVLTIARAL
jgi:ComF family protein